MKIAPLLQKILPPAWLGMVVAVAAEAQLKFQAPGITRELGLGIGKIVFTALNRAECVIGIVLAIALFAFTATKKTRIVFGIIFIILLAQTFWLMPDLINRIDLITSGNTPPASVEHFIYITLEVCKIGLLTTLSVLANLQTGNETGY